MKKIIFTMVILCASVMAVTAQTDTILVQNSDTIQECYLKLVKRVQNQRGWLNNRNSDNFRGIYGYVKGVYFGCNKIFFMIDLENKTNIDYDIESIAFISNPIKDGKKQLTENEMVYMPIWQTNIQKIGRKSTNKLIFVFDKFVIADNKNILFTMYELDGERTLVLQIKSDYFLNARYLR